MFELIRYLFAKTQDAKAPGYPQGRISFSVKGGRRESCKGDGILKIEMHFLPDVIALSEVCKGKRCNRETLEVKFKGNPIAGALDRTISEAVEFFGQIPNIARKFQTLRAISSRRSKRKFSTKKAASIESLRADESLLLQYNRERKFSRLFSGIRA